MTRNGVLSLLNRNSRLEPPKLRVKRTPQSCRTLIAQVVADNKFPPDLLTDLPALQKSGSTKDHKSVPDLVTCKVHVDLRRPNVLPFHQSTHMVKSRIFIGFPLPARFTISDLLFRNRNTRCGIHRCNEAAVFDTYSSRALRSCVNVLLLSHEHSDPYVFAPVPDLQPVKLQGCQCFTLSFFRPGTSQNEIS